MIARLLAVLTVVALVAAPSASAAAPRASFNDLEDEVMCDVCGVPLNILYSHKFSKSPSSRLSTKLIIR